MAACFVSVHSIMDTPHFSGDAVHGARNRNDYWFFKTKKTRRKDESSQSIIAAFKLSLHPADACTFWCIFGVKKWSLGRC